MRAYVRCCIKSVPQRASTKLGFIPKENSGKGQPNFKNQITWFLQLESLLSEVIELGLKSTDLEKEAFAPSHINSIIGMFRGVNAKMLQLAQGSKFIKCK